MPLSSKNAVTTGLRPRTISKRIMDNSLTQYIELFEQNRTVIEAHSPATFNRRRAGALATLKSLGKFPDRGDEGYPKISLNEMFAPDYGLNITRINFGAEGGAFGCDHPISGRPAAWLVNDSFAAGDTSQLPEGIEVCSLAEAAEKYPDLFGDEIAPADNPVVALNNLLVQDGIFIRVARGVKAGRPVQILGTFNASQPMMGIRRVKIVVEEGAHAEILMCDHPAAQAAPHLSCRVVEATVGCDATLNVYDLEEAGESSRRVSVFASVQHRGSNLNLSGLFLNGGNTRNEFYPRHAGEHCSTRLGGVVIGGGRQIIDNSVSLTHTHPRCTSEQLFKYALFDSAEGSFEGMVKVAEGAEFSDARQTNRNLLASPDARMYAMPQLEIYCDEVKASHGSATGQLDENALFYMRSRGIPEAEARMMLVNAFMTDVLDGIGNEPLRERLRHLVDRRLRGVETVCAGCVNN